MKGKSPNMDNEVMETAPVYGCPKCGKAFNSKAGVHLHNMRVHGKLTGSPRWRKKTKASEEEQRRKKREYQLALRERYYREGKNARGQQMPPGWVPRGRTPLSKSIRRRAYQKKWYAANKAKKLQQSPGIEAAAAPEIWIMVSSGIIHCPHCHKVVGEIKAQKQETNSQWHIA